MTARAGGRTLLKVDVMTKRPLSLVDRQDAPWLWHSVCVRARACACAVRYVVLARCIVLYTVCGAVIGKLWILLRASSAPACLLLIRSPALKLPVA